MQLMSRLMANESNSVKLGQQKKLLQHCSSQRITPRKASAASSNTTKSAGTSQPNQQKPGTLVDQIYKNSQNQNNKIVFEMPKIISALTESSVPATQA